jgi:NAD(P)-dependent dehydrogenase (short-subunit alcohol dehydrogenase family)
LVGRSIPRIKARGSTFANAIVKERFTARVPVIGPGEQERVGTCSFCGNLSQGMSRTASAQKKSWKERTPMSRLGEADELNHLVVFPVSDASTYMTESDIIIDVSHPHVAS